MYRRRALATWIVSALLVCSCSQAVETPDAVQGVTADTRVEAEAMQTTIAVAVEATLTMIAALRTAVPIDTGVPTSRPSPTETSRPKSTAPAATNAPTTDVAGCTPNSDFESDVTIPDNTKIASNTTFTKTWKVTNNGTCDWGAGFFLKHVGGDRLNGPDSVAVPLAKAGETVDVSVVMKAPDKPGTYTSKWQICAGADRCFGAKLFAQIVAVSP